MSSQKSWVCKMQSRLARICLFLASSDLRPSEIKSLGRWIERNGGESFAGLIEHLRREAEIDGLSVRYSSRVEPVRRSANTSHSSDIAERIETLLVNEAGLSKSVAAEILREEAQRLVGSNVELPSSQKVAFSLWIERLASIIPESQLLHLAARIRNKLAHPYKQDWPLKGDQ